MNQQPATSNQQPEAEPRELSPAEALAAGAVGLQLSFSWLGDSRAVDDCQAAEAARLFEADADSVKAVKRILNPSRPELRALNLKRNEARRYWLSVTLPYLRGVRLLPTATVEAVEARLNQYAAEVRELAAGLTSIHAELIDEARRRLGRLFNAADYPASLADAFRLGFNFVAVAPPEYLAQIAPEVYRREAERVRRQFEAAAEAAEAALAAEFGAMVERVTATLSATDSDGKPRIFRDSMIGNLTDFFDRFRSLRIGSGAELAAVIDRAQALTRNVTPQALRDSASLRTFFVDQFAAVERELNAAIVPAGRRLRTVATPEPNAEPQPEPATEAAPDTEPQAEPVAVAEPAAVRRLRVAEPQAAESQPEPQAAPVALVRRIRRAAAV